MSALDTSTNVDTSADFGAPDANTSGLNTSQTLGQQGIDQVVQSTSPQLSPTSPQQVRTPSQLGHTSPQLTPTSPQLQHRQDQDNATDALNTSTHNVYAATNTSAVTTMSGAADTAASNATPVVGTNATPTVSSNAPPNATPVVSSNAGSTATGATPNTSFAAADSVLNTSSNNENADRANINTSRSFTPPIATTATTSPHVSPIRSASNMQATNVFTPVPIVQPPTQVQSAQLQPTQVQHTQQLQPMHVQALTQQLQSPLQTYNNPYALKMPDFSANVSGSTHQQPMQQQQIMQPMQSPYSLVSHYPASNPYTLESVNPGAYSSGPSYSNLSSAVVSSNRPTTSTTTTTSAGSQSLTTWSSGEAAGPRQGTKENPLHINQCIDILDRMALTAPTSGAKDSQHYAVRFINENVRVPPGSSITVGRDNSTSSPTYYADVNVDIAKSRSDKDLSSRGYYELKGAGIGIDGALFESLKAKLRTFKNLVPDTAEDKQLRIPIFVSTVGNVRFHPRVFEFYTGKNKDKETMEVYIGNTEDGQASMRKINISFPEYRSYVGKARVIGNFSLVTKANGYVKLVFTCRCLILTGNHKKMVGGLEFDTSSTETTSSNVPTNVDPTEWSDLQKLLHEHVNSGIPVHMLMRVLKEGISSTISAATRDSKYQMPQSTNVHPQSQQHLQQLQQQYQPQQVQNQVQPQMQNQVQYQPQQVQNQVQPQMQNQVQPQQSQQQQYQMQYQPQGIYGVQIPQHLQPQMQNQVQPQMQNQVQPQMQNQVQPQMQNQVQNQARPASQPGAQFVTNLAQMGLHNMPMYNSSLHNY